MPRAKYTDDEAAEILRRALERQQGEGTLAHEDLVAAAREVGIDARNLEAAASELADRRAIDAERARTRSGRRRALVWHASIYALVTLFLFAINRLVTPYPWFLFPALSWGLGLAIHALAALMAGDESEAKIRRRLERRARREQKLERRARTQASAREFERSVELGVAALLDVVADRVRTATAPRDGERFRGRVRIDAAEPSRRDAVPTDNSERVEAEAEARGGERGQGRRTSG